MPGIYQTLLECLISLNLVLRSEIDRASFARKNQNNSISGELK